MDKLAQTSRNGAPRPRRKAVANRRRTVELLLDLAPIRRDLEAKWDKIAPSVRRFATHVIERHLAASGTFSLSGDVFTIRFDGIGAGEAARRLQEIEKTLAELLFGSGAIDLPGIGRRSRWASRAQRERDGRFGRLIGTLRRILKPFGIGHSDNRRSIHALTRGTAAMPERELAPATPTEETMSTSPGSSPVDPAAPVSGPALPPHALAAGFHGFQPSPTTAGLRRVATASGWPAATSAAGPADPAWWSTNEPPAPKAPAAVAPGGGVAAHRYRPGAGTFDGELVFVDPPPDEPAIASSRARGRVRRSATEALERALYQAILEAERRNDLAQRARLFPPLGTRFLYRPLWLVERGVAPIYTCTPACALGPFEFVTGDALLTKGSGARKIAMLDEMLIDHVANELRPRLPEQLRALTCVPVHYETLTGDRAAAWNATLESIPGAVRKSMIVEIVNLSQGVGQLATFALVRRLKARVRSVVGRLDNGDVNFRVWRQTDLAVVGIDVETDTRSEVEIIGDINNFAASTKQHGMRSYVRGVRSLSLAAAAIASGVNYVDGPAVAEGDFLLPQQPRSFGIFDIYESS
jgi:hypothetical protein